MPGFTNRGKYLMAQLFFRNTGAPTTFYMALVTDAAIPDPDTNLLSDLTQIPVGNGYSSGGLAVARDNVDFDVLTEDDGNDRGFVQIKDLIWTASGGNLPASGSGARYAVLTTDEVTVANRQIIAFFDLGANRIVSDTQELRLIDTELRLND